MKKIIHILLSLIPVFMLIPFLGFPPQLPGLDIIPGMTATAFASDRGQRHPGDDKSILALKTLNRWPDPVIITADFLPSFVGKPIHILRLYSRTEAGFAPLPFQIDEKTGDGRKVLSFGPDNNAGEANGLLDRNEELIFMARDGGHRVGPTKWPEGHGLGREICIVDPLSHKKAWVYLFSFPVLPPPLSPRVYVWYDGETNTDWSRYYMAEDISWVDNHKRYDTIYYQAFNSPREAGGTGIDFIDRLKVKIDVSLFWGSLHLRFNHANIIGQNLSWQPGPVRITRRVWVAMQFPLGLRSPRFDTDIVQYDTIHTCPFRAHVPIRLKRIGAAVTLWLGTDLNRQAYGMRWYNSNNTDGFLIDGNMGPRELNMDKSIDKWRLVTGEHGTVIWRALWDETFLRQIEGRVVYEDNVTAPDPPEFEQGQVGAAYIEEKIADVKAGYYMFYMEFYHPPHFFDPSKPDQLNRKLLQAYLNIQDHPLSFTIGDERGASMIRTILDKSKIKGNAKITKKEINL